MKTTIELGATVTPRATVPVLLDFEELLATRLLVQGNSGSGKSHLLRRLLEQSAGLVQQVVIDPEGEFVGLSDRYGHVVVDAQRGLTELEVIAGRIRENRISAILNLESLDVELQMRAAATFLNALFDADRSAWFPLLVVVDEAQLFAPAAAGEVAEDARRLSLAAMTNLMCRGRKRGLAGIIATQRLAKLAKNVAAEASNFLMGRTFLDIDMARAADLLGLERRQAEMFRDLERGQFVALGPALSRRPVSVKVGPVETEAERSVPRLTPPPEPVSDDARGAILAPIPVVRRQPAERRVVVPASTNEILERAVRMRATATGTEIAVPAMPTAERVLAFASIAHAIMTDDEALFRPEMALYQDFLARVRIANIGGPPLPLPDFRWYLNVARAGVDPAGEHRDRWQQAVDAAAAVPSDLQAVYLIIAAAAMTGAACPSDREIARRCGSYSAGRARSQIRHLERSGHIALRVDLKGLRTVACVGLGWETAPGDPDAPDRRPSRDGDLIAAE